MISSLIAAWSLVLTMDQGPPKVIEIREWRTCEVLQSMAQRSLAVETATCRVKRPVR